MKKIIVLALALSLLNTVDAQWANEQLSTPRSFLGSAQFGNQLYFVGGNASSSTILNSVDVYNTSSNTWDTPLTLPQAVSGATVVAGDSAIYVAGGSGTSGLSNLVQIYKNGAWSTDTLQENFTYASSVHVGNKIIICGLSLNLSGTSIDKYYMYDEVTEAWSTGTLSEARSDIGVATDGNIVMFGGGYNTANDVSKRIDIYNAATNTWSIDSLSTPRLLASGAYANGKFVFAGGANPGTTSSTVVDIFDGTNWTTANLSTARGGAISAVVNDVIYFIGGSVINIQGGAYMSFETRMDVYNAASDTWSQLDLTTGRTAHAVEVANNKIYVGGGLTQGFASVNSIEIYTPTPLGIQEYNTLNINIYPNPTSSIINFTIKENGILSIFNLRGERVFNSQVTIGNNTINISSLSKGFYTVQIISGQSVSRENFIKQ